MDWAGIDEWIYRRLTELVDVLPMRFVKLVAHNYTDALGYWSASESEC